MYTDEWLKCISENFRAEVVDGEVILVAIEEDVE